MLCAGEICLGNTQGNSQDVRVWFLTLNVGSEYPKEPPTIKFTSKVNMDCVDSKGNVRSHP